MSIKTMSLDEVTSLTSDRPVQVTGSFMQANRHTLVSDRFQPIQPAAIAGVLAKHGFKPVSVLTGKGRHEDKLDFQRTISRYRHETNLLDDMGLDLIYISKHLGRGVDELRLGLYRGLCANQWAVGTLFESVKIRHNGNAIENLEQGIMTILLQRDKLVKTIKDMQATKLTKEQILDLSNRFAMERIGKKTDYISAINLGSLLQIHREGDASTDLWTVANVLQENVIRFPVQYRTKKINEQGQEVIRSMTSRVLKESSSQLVDLNSRLFDIASQAIAA